MVVPGKDPAGQRNFVIADIPGLIPGASEGAGLGVRFLKHIERTRVLLHLVSFDPGEGRDPLSDYLALRKELVAFDPELAKRPEIVALSKADLTDVREAYPALKAKFKRKKVDLRLLSAPTQEGVTDLVYALAQELDRQKLELETQRERAALREANQKSDPAG